MILLDMEMPERCYDCTFLDDTGDNPMCRVNGEVRGYNFPSTKQRMESCPLHEMPACQEKEGSPRGCTERTGMTFDEYQELAGRTINGRLTREEKLRHSLFEMCGELGEIHSIYQKVYQGHQIRTEDLKLESGDLLWGLAEFCTVNGFSLREIAEMNIDKLRKRYPQGFAEDRSVNRDEWDE